MPTLRASCSAVVRDKPLFGSSGRKGEVGLMRFMLTCPSTPPRRWRAESVTCSSTPKVWCLKPSYTAPMSRTKTESGYCWARRANALRAFRTCGSTRATRGGAGGLRRERGGRAQAAEAGAGGGGRGLGPGVGQGGQKDGLAEADAAEGFPGPAEEVGCGAHLRMDLPQSEDDKRLREVVRHR
jgi:hypothetical protein